MLKHGKPVGQRVAIIGAGGIGFDVAEFLVHENTSIGSDVDLFNREWGVDKAYESRGAWAKPDPEKPAREVIMLQRKASKMGAGLGKTSGWVHRSSLKMKGVEMITGASYEKIDDQGLHITLNATERRIIECDNIIVCAGQIPCRDLQGELEVAGIPVHLLGGSRRAGELDAKRAIQEGLELTMELG